MVRTKLPPKSIRIPIYFMRDGKNRIIIDVDGMQEEFDLYINLLEENGFIIDYFEDEEDDE